MNGFSVVFSEPVNAQVLSWRGVLVPLESHPDPELIYTNFNFGLEIQPGFDEVNITFGVEKSNGDISIYKATYDSALEIWNLTEDTLN